jgi:hypothetical protein
MNIMTDSDKSTIESLEPVSFKWNDDEYRKFAYDGKPEYVFYSPPKQNWRWRFGDSQDVYFQFHIKNPPNRLQRWIFKKLTGIRWERVE